MIISNDSIKNVINSPVRKIGARVELYEGSTLIDSFDYNGKLISFTVERVSEEGKFFGFGICQHAKVEILDVNREVDYITTNHSFKISYGVNGEYTTSHPTFFITQSRRDEKTNKLTFYGYDLIYSSAAHTLAELELEAPYSINTVSSNIADVLGFNAAEVIGLPPGSDPFTTNYPTGANFEGTETLREMLDDIAEATQTIYFVGFDDKLIFKRLSDTTEPDIKITKAEYIELETKDGKRLGTIVSATELGDNYSSSTDATGSTQYVRDNGFWELRDDIAKLVDVAIAEMGGLSIRQFDCKWRGNFLTEPGDKIELTTKDNNTVISYLLDDVIEYNGTLSQTTKWEYDEDDTESESNPTSLGDILKSTYAKVDKANKQIDLVASETADNKEAITQIQLTTDELTLSVKRVEDNNIGNIENLQQQVEELTYEVKNTMTAEAIRYEISKQIQNGTDSITTSTGFTFDENGLTISKSGAEVETMITEDGMTISKSGDSVLTADNTGVYATNLHATTYLIIGLNSRFEDYDNGARTGCFWIGG